MVDTRPFFLVSTFTQIHNPLSWGVTPFLVSQGHFLYVDEMIGYGLLIAFWCVMNECGI